MWDHVIFFMTFRDILMLSKYRKITPVGEVVLRLVHAVRQALCASYTVVAPMLAVIETWRNVYHLNLNCEQKLC